MNAVYPESLASRGALSASDAQAIIEALCRALGQLHARGAVHRNISPDSVFVSLTNDAWSAILRDARDGAPSPFSAPEALEGETRLRPSSDVWSLGLVAFWALTGRAYWLKADGARWLGALREEILTAKLEPASARAATLGAGPLPEGFDDWFARCVAPDPTGRFRDGAAALQALPWRKGAPLSTAVASTPAPAPQPFSAPAPEAGPFTRAPAAPARRLPWAAGAVGALVLLASAGAWRATHRPTATPAASVQSLGKAIDLAAGSGHTCAVFERGAVMCWGANNRGQLGAVADFHGEPVRVPGLAHAVRISAGEEHTCARLADGAIECFGHNSSGQLGRETLDPNPRVRVPGITAAQDMALGVFHSCARLSDRTVRCWGANAHGQLGDGTAEMRERPVSPQDQADIVQMAAGGSDTCAVRAGGTVHCWGTSYGSGPGAGPQEVEGLGEVVQVSVGQGDACALRRDETVTCWSAIRC